VEILTYKAYVDNIKAKTGKDPAYFQKLAKEKGLVKHAELLSWLKSDCGWDMVTLTRLFCISMTLTSPRRSYWKTRRRRNPESRASTSSMVFFLRGEGRFVSCRRA